MWRFGRGPTCRRNSKASPALGAGQPLVPVWSAAFFGRAPQSRKITNLLTARFIFGHFVPAIGSRKSPPKAGSAHFWTAGTCTREARRRIGKEVRGTAKANSSEKKYEARRRCGKEVRGMAKANKIQLFWESSFSEARFIDGAGESVFQNCIFQASHSRSRPTPQIRIVSGIRFFRSPVHR